MTVIEVNQLARRFSLPSGKFVDAVQGVSFSVAASDVYGLLGPNGAGKTTTLRMLLGLLKPTSGHARVAGHSSIREPDEVKRCVGYVSSSAGVYPFLTTREMLLYFADLYGVERADAADELERLSCKLGMKPFLDRPCTTLSTGQKQRVNLARALMHRPPVMLLDEPTLGLDVVGSQMVAEFIELLRDEGKAVILCTHRLDDAERLCNRFGLMHRGRIVSEGTLAELRERTNCDNLVAMFLKLAEIGPVLSDADAGDEGQAG